MPKLHLTPITYCAAYKLCAPVLFVLLAVTSACAQQRRFGAEYVPFVDGSQATYNVQTTYTDGTKIEAQSVVIIKGKTLIQGKEYYKQVSTATVLNHPRAPAPNQTVVYFRVASDGIYKIRGDNMDAPEVLDMPLPILIGRKWARVGVESQFEYVGTVTVGGRSYRDCLKMTGVASEMHVQAYFAPNVGAIKINTTISSHYEMDFTLESYKP